MVLERCKPDESCWDLCVEEFFPDSLTTPRQKEAQADAQAAAAAKARPPVRVGDLLRDYLLIARRNLELSTYNCYQQVAKNHLLPQWEDKPAAALTTHDLRKWIMGLNGKSKTIQLILTPMRNAIELGVRQSCAQRLRAPRKANRCTFPVTRRWPSSSRSTSSTPPICVVATRRSIMRNDLDLGRSATKQARPRSLPIMLSVT